MRAIELSIVGVGPFEANCVLINPFYTFPPTFVLSLLFNVYCPECPPGGTIGHLGGQQKNSFCRSMIAEISKA